MQKFSHMLSTLTMVIQFYYYRNNKFLITLATIFFQRLNTQYSLIKFIIEKWTVKNFTVHGYK